MPTGLLDSQPQEGGLAVKSLNYDPEKALTYGTVYLIAIVDIVDQQSKPSMKHIVTSVSPKYHILLTMVHLAFKIATFATHPMDRTNISSRRD
jgi:hypothetical protein